MNFYAEATRILDVLDSKKGSVKGCLASSNLPQGKDRKRLAALVIETLKFKPALSSIISNSSLLTAEKRLLPSLNTALPLVHDLLFTKGARIQTSDGPIKQAIMRHRTRLQAELVKLQVKKGVAKKEDLAVKADERAEAIPRYVRVNTNIWPVASAVSTMTSERLTFTQDPHIPTLLAFPPSTPSTSFALGKLILQDKASCFPAFVLLSLESPSSLAKLSVIDATAAPGNKTSHASGIMQNKGKIFAFERSPQRYKTLVSQLAKAKCQNVEAMNLDFLTVDPHDPKYNKVSHILVDPSCSGSGIVNRLDYLLSPPENPDDDALSSQSERLTKLASFQLSMIQHAMKFSGMKRIVYSTCSIHAEENEDVVQSALSKSSEWVLAGRNDVLPSWNRRGLGEGMEGCIRCDPTEDATNGFFVACFVRRDARNEQEAPKRKRVDEEDSHSETDQKESLSTGKKRKKKKKKRKRGTTEGHATYIEQGL